MEHQPKSMIVRCHVIGEFIDEAEGASSAVSPDSPVSAIEKRHVLGPFEEWGAPESPNGRSDLQEFVVLFNNKERLTVRGSGLRYIPGGPDQRDGGTYAVVIGTPGSEIIVALLKQTEVIGIIPATRPLELPAQSGT